MDVMERAALSPALSLQQKALRIHLSTLHISILAHIVEIKEMEALHDRLTTAYWSNLLLNNERLVQCITMYMEGTTPLTAMHLAVVSRLSDAYCLETKAAKHCYDSKTAQPLLRNATQLRLSAKFMAYAIVSARTNDSILQSCCFDVAEALQTPDNHSNKYSRCLAMSGENALRSIEVASKGYSALASAYAFLARCDKIVAATRFLVEYRNLGSVAKEQNGWRITALRECESLLRKAENFLMQNQTKAANVLIELVMSHKQYDGKFTRAKLDHVLQLFMRAINCANGLAIVVPESIISGVDRDLPNQLWKRALLSSNNDVAKKFMEYATEMMKSLADISDRADLCQRQAKRHASVKQTTSAYLWNRALDAVHCLPKKIIDAAVLLRDSETGEDCMDWEQVRDIIKHASDWEEIDTMLSTVYALKATYVALRKRNTYAHPPPAVVCEGVEAFWSTAIQVVQTFIDGLENAISADIGVCPTVTWWQFLFENVQCRTRYCAAHALALHAEACKHLQAAREANLVGAQEVAVKYTELACLAAVCSTTDFATKHEEMHSQSTWSGSASDLPFQNEMPLFHDATSELSKALVYYIHANNTMGTDISEVWRELYVQQLHVATNTMKGAINRVKAAAPHLTAIDCLLRRVEEGANATPTYLSLLEELECDLAVRITQPGLSNLLLVKKAYKICNQFITLNRSEPTSEVLKASALNVHCAALCINAFAETSELHTYDTDVLLASANLIIDTQSDKEFVLLSRTVVGVIWVAEVVTALLSDTKFKSLTTHIGDSQVVLSQELCAHRDAMIGIYRASIEVYAAADKEKLTDDRDNNRLCNGHMYAYRQLRVLAIKHAVYLSGNTNVNVETELEEGKLRVERLRQARQAYGRGEKVISECYSKMADACTVGNRPKWQHIESMQRYLDIIDTVSSNDPALIAMMVAAADRYQEYTRNYVSFFPESSHMLRSQAADARLAAFLAGRQSNVKKQKLLTEASEMYAKAASLNESSPGLVPTLTAKLARSAEKIIVSFCEKVGCIDHSKVKGKKRKIESTD